MKKRGEKRQNCQPKTSLAVRYYYQYNNISQLTVSSDNKPLM